MTITISVDNIGPITSASVRLKPLTVFVGPNNAGKSVLATVVYAATQKRPGLSPAALGLRLRRYSRSLPDQEASPPEDEPPLWLDHLLSARPGATRFDALPDDARLSLAEYLEHSFEGYASELAGELERCLGATLRDLRGPAEPRAATAIMVRCNQPSWHIKIILKPGRVSLDVAPPDVGDVLPAFLRSLADEDREKIVGLPARVVVPLVRDGMAWHAVSGVPRKSWYLPAARSGLLQNHRALAGSLLRRRSEGENTMPALPGIVTDFLGEMVELDERRWGSYSEIAHEVEAGVLNGEIRLVSEPLDDVEIRYRAGGHDLPLHRTSSMVSELAPVVLYLRHLVRKHHRLVIEEPEAHLHPASQTALARVVCELVNAQLSILLTTHSEFFLKQINNLVSASGASAEALSAAGVREGSMISPDGVAAYFFSPAGKNGTEVAELKVDSDSGISDSSFFEVAESLYDQSMTLYRLGPGQGARSLRRPPVGGDLSGHVCRG